MKHIASISHGKDSLRMIEAIVVDLKLPLDEIVAVDVMFNKERSAYFSEVDEFRKKADEIIKERYGITVKHLRSELTYEERFYTIRGGHQTKRENRGKIYGFPIVRGAWCNSDLKMAAINKYKAENPDSFWYIGYALDEKRADRQEKIKNCKDLNMYPLVKAKITEQECYDWCKRNDLLSPVYENAARDGCWFCHYQTLDQLRDLRKNHPEEWEIMLQLDLYSPTSFRPGGVSIHDLEERFKWEDAQMSIFDFIA